ncbi:hypothetical protein [Rhodococcus qingshengii]|uniref:hypothetical protein n=1 Tax=Rhodococcus qingshengii TaxID=334542 RepID=UPI0029435F57|nr:hypothetical protein [Rhodococcus qingshengii]WOI85965.1 hypothetical protein R0122_22565 [Rhodococcus qingshengii]
MITRPTFIALLDAIQRQSDHDSSLEDHINALTPESVDSVFLTPLTSDLVPILEVELDDQNEWISWWLWDAPDAGKNIDGSTVTTSGGHEVVLRNAGDLYDWVRVGSKFDCLSDGESLATTA